MYQSIYEFAEAIDEAAWYYRVGQIQKLRKTLRGLGCQAGSGIFQIHRLDDNERDYAYHWGGRDECQFNIRFLRGRKNNYIEYGLAFSLESIRGNSVVENMRPKIERFNEYVRLHNGDFRDYRIAVNRPHRPVLIKSGLMPTIPNEWIDDGNFISLFNMYKEKADYDGVHNILEKFNQLYTLYTYTMI